MPRIVSMISNFQKDRPAGSPSWPIVHVLVATIVATGCLADEPPPKESAPTNVQPATDRLSSGDAKLDAILDRLETKGKTMKGLSCKLLYRYVMVEVVQDEQVKEGSLLFARGEPNSRFFIHFNKLLADGVVKDTGEYWAFDGRWLVERNDLTKKIIRREIAREGQREDPFKIGEGPFPLPLGQKREDILANFKVKREDFTLGDPRNTDHLHCVPLPNTALADKYSRVEIYVDRALELPVRVVSERVKDGNRIEVDFRDIDVRQAPDGSRFRIEEPKDFEVSIEPLTPANP
ncbi:MAG TPA: hypothetical protein VJZ71_02425 [Phycisphaerae bacterium]|nr:hypothetical protein [Phycisphaerae bacterium]